MSNGEHRIENAAFLDVNGKLITKGFIEISTNDKLPAWKFFPQDGKEAPSVLDKAKSVKIAEEGAKNIKNICLCGGGLFGQPIHFHFDYE